MESTRSKGKRAIRTSVDVNKALLDKVMRCEGEKSKEEVLDTALGQYLTRQKRPKGVSGASREAERVRKRWSDWLERIRNEVASLHEDRAIFGTLMDMTDENEELRARLGSLYEWIIRNYVQRASITVRRLIDHCDDSVSLATLIDDISSYRFIISREAYLAQWTDGMSSSMLHVESVHANEAFDIVAGVGGKCPDPDIMSGKLEWVRSRTSKIKAFANSTVAHMSRAGAKSATFGDLDAGIEAVGGLFNWICLLLTCSTIHNLEPTIDWSWVSVFDVPITQSSATADRQPTQNS